MHDVLWCRVFCSVASTCVRVYCGQASSAPDAAAGTDAPADVEADKGSAAGPKTKRTPTREELHPGWQERAAESRSCRPDLAGGFGELSGLYASSPEASRAPGAQPAAAVPNPSVREPVKKTITAKLREQLNAFLLAHPTFQDLKPEDLADSQETGASPLLSALVLSRDDLSDLLQEWAGIPAYDKWMQVVRRADRDLAAAVLDMADKVATDVNSKPGNPLVPPIWSHVPLDWDLKPKPGGWLTGSAEIGDGALRPVQVVRDCGDAPRYCVHLTAEGLYMAYSLLPSDEERLVAARQDIIRSHRSPAPEAPTGTTAGPSMQPPFPTTPGVRAVPLSDQSRSPAGHSRRLFPAVMPDEREMDAVVRAMLDHYRPFQGSGLSRTTVYKLFGTSISPQVNVLTLHGAMVRSIRCQLVPTLSDPSP